MSLKGKIISISDNANYAKVIVKPVVNCNGCKACAGLINKSNFNDNKEIEITVLTNNLKVEVGDYVLVELTETQGTKIALLIYGLPIIGFLFGMISAPYLCNLINLPLTDLVRVISSFLCLFLTYFFIFLYFKYINNKSNFMIISKKL